MQAQMRKELIAEKLLPLSEIKDNIKSIEIYGKNENVNDIVKSMEQIGYDNEYPIILNQDNIIVSGHRRKWAAIKFGLKEVPVKIYKYSNDIIELQDLLLNNVQRKKSNDIIGREWKEYKYIEQEQSKERQKESGGDKISNEYKQFIEHSKFLSVDYICNQPIEIKSVDTTKNITFESVKEREKTTLQRGAITYDISDKQLHQIETVTGKIDDLKNSGKIEVAEELRKVLKKSADSAYNIVKKKCEDVLIKPEIKILTNNENVAGTKIEREVVINQNQDIQSKELTPLPLEEFNVILVDPPWQYTLAETTRQIENQYSTMSDEDICKLPIPAAKDCILFLWATTGKLPVALKVIESWGFEYKSSAIWNKMIMGMGYYFRGQHEFLLVGRKGNPGIPKSEDRYSSVIEAKRTEHSTKPEIVYDMIEKMYPDKKYLEMFARKKHSDKWVSWGSEI